EPYAVKVARTVLRRAALGNKCRLSDSNVLGPTQISLHNSICEQSQSSGIRAKRKRHAPSLFSPVT
ncbi:hypothetical protein L9W98_09020, partial [Vibrio aestuarianus]|nr:hypothetical protein [Vibrio aestuarianus]MDE1296630.1 hypothetical protein [Vibrio aestuarianus]